MKQSIRVRPRKCAAAHQCRCHIQKLILALALAFYFPLCKSKNFCRTSIESRKREKKLLFFLSFKYTFTHIHTRTCVQTVGCRRDFIAKPYECAFLSIRETMCVYVMQISSISLNRVSLFFFCKSFLPHIDLATLSPSISLHLSVYICNGGIIVAVVILLSIAM